MNTKLAKTMVWIFYKFITSITKVQRVLFGRYTWCYRFWIFPSFARFFANVDALRCPICEKRSIIENGGRRSTVFVNTSACVPLRPKYVVPALCVDQNATPSFVGSFFDMVDHSSCGIDDHFCDRYRLDTYEISNEMVDTIIRVIPFV